MTEIPDYIVGAIRSILEKSKSTRERIIRHDFIQNSLYLFFDDMKFIPIKEYSINYRNKYRNKKRFGESRFIRDGKIDLYSYKDNLNIAIEYDNAATLKWKSIEKLFQCDAKFCFGMISGPKNYTSKLNDFYVKKNIWKLQQTFKEHLMLYNEIKDYESYYKLLNKRFWLGIGSAGYLEEFNLKDILNLETGLYYSPQINNTIKLSPGVKNLKKKYSEVIYVLRLGNNKWWVGRTKYFDKKIKSIRKGKGRQWIRTNGFKAVEEIIENGDLIEKTLEYMKKYGWENVRGTYWHDGPQTYIPKRIIEYVSEQENTINKGFVKIKEIKLNSHREKIEDKLELVYILKLEKDKWCIGKTSDLTSEVEKHRKGEGNSWTKLYKVLSVEKVIEGGDEKAVTLEYMKKYGWWNVRGFYFKGGNWPPEEISEQFNLYPEDNKEKHIVYVLKLEQDKWFIGKTNN
ncbi:MAG: hypothetical protein ACFFD2_07175, partial [Promethearchaeota archaeon]